MNTAHFEWKKEYSVKVKLLDEQHQQLIKTIDNLYQAILESKGNEALAGVFANLNNYVNTHFAEEEKHFKEFNFPGAAAHTSLHLNFKKELSDMENKAADDDTTVKLLFFLENWWINHILDIDKRYSDFFNQHGLV